MSGLLLIAALTGWAAFATAMWQAKGAEDQRDELAKSNAFLARRLREQTAPASDTPIHDGLVIDIFRDQMHRLDETRETWGPA